MQADRGEMEPIQKKGIQELDYLQYPSSILKVTDPTQSRKLMSCYGARNRFQEPSLELSQAT
jgi:hypothetical protein